MSTLSEEQIAIIARERAGAPHTELLRFISQIDAGLNELAERIARSPQMRHWLLTPRATTTTTLDGNGIADLSTLVITNKILLNYLRFGNIYTDDPDYPNELILVNSMAQLKAGTPYGGMFIRAYREGDKLHTYKAGGTLAGNLSFVVPYVPTRAQLPNALNDDLVAVIVELMRAAQPQEAPVG